MKKGKKHIFIIVAVVLVLILVGVGIWLAVGGKHEDDETAKNVIDPAYTLVWEDNFDGTELNMNDWNYEYHEPGWVNNELQEYVDSSENIYVKDGNLVIQAIKTEQNGQVTYTSGRVNTQNKHDFKYGRIEARIKMPSGKGFLPAFWMMPTDENLYGQWPKCGEVDIAEVLGNDTHKVYANLHFGEPHTQNQGSLTLKEGDFASEFHIYACEWDPNEFRFYVDGELYHTVNDWFTAKEGFGEVTYPAPYDQPFYIILNLAVGGSWPGNPDSTTGFGENAQMVVDYVRVYQKESYDENVTRPVANVALRNADETGNYVVNGDFSEAEELGDTENWIFLLAGTGAGTAEITNNEMVITPTRVGDLEYSVQLVQGNMPMEQGMKYRLSFDAYASEPRDIITAVTAPDNSWIRYLQDTKFPITTEKKNYSFEFDMTENSDANGRVEFNLGRLGSTAQVRIANVRLEQIGKVEQAAEAKTVLPDGNYVYNGEFQQGTDRMEYWLVENQCDGADVSVTNINNVRELKAVVPNTVTALDQVVVKEDGLAIIANKSYVLSFDAYADGATTIQTTIAGQTFETNLTTQKTTYKYALETGDTVDTTLKFLLGTEGTIYIDNVRIQEDGMLINGDFSNGMVGYELYAYTTGDVNYGVDSLSEDSAFSIDISNTGDLDWKIQLKQNNITLENGKWYTLSFDAKSSLDRKIMYTLQRDGSSDDNWIPYSGAPIISLTSEYQSFSVTFQMTSETDEATILSISMGAVDGTQISQKHTVRIDNIVLVEVEAPQ